MDDLAKAFSMNWPILALCAVALTVVFVALKGSISGIQRSLADVRERQEKLGSKVGELERSVETVARQWTDVVGRVADAERELESHRAASAEQIAALDQRVGGRRATDLADGSDDDVPMSIDRFNAAAETLSQLARELDGFDSRHGDNWLRIKGDLDEQGFQLQRVQQHVDRLFEVATSDSRAPAHTN